MPESGKRILSIGLVCLDVVNVVRSFPLEDTDQRSVDQYSSRGGNASNSASVLAQLGEKNVEYFGTLAEGALETELVKKDFEKFGINIEHCIKHEGCVCPNSCVIVNQQNASRTIIHTNKNLPELTCSDFKSLDLSRYSWLHFEGRNLEEVKLMIDYAKSSIPSLNISVEVEKVGRNFEELVPYGDVVLISKDVAKCHGAETMLEALELFKAKLKPSAKLVCAWGDRGAAGFDSKLGLTVESPAFPPENGIVDTLGAGDTFNGTVIGALNSGMDLGSAVRLGCRIAGAKVGQRGFQGLKEVYESLKK